MNGLEDNVGPAIIPGVSMGTGTSSSPSGPVTPIGSQCVCVCVCVWGGGGLTWI